MTANLQAKIEVTIGRVTFSGEGTQDWLADQLDKVLKVASSHPASLEEANDGSQNSKPENGPGSGETSIGSLANYLKVKEAGSNQVRRFLATAGWLSKKGAKTLKTADVSKALKDNQQKKLGNPSDSLNQNVGKGFCEKTGDGFFITPEGWESLGESA